MAATRMNSVFQCLDQSIGHAFRRAGWETTLKERFAEIEPWLIPSPHRAEKVGCEHTQTRFCSYRVVEHADGKLVGVCDEGRCKRRVLSPEELIQYQPNLSRLRMELARLLELEPDRTAPPQAYILPIGKFTLGRDRFEVKLVGGLNPCSLPELLMRMLNVHGPRQVILLASSFGDKAPLKDFIHRAGWHWYDIEHAFEIKPRRLEWRNGSLADWLSFKRELVPPANIQEDAAKPYVRAIERGFADLGKDISNYKEEIERLRAGLSEQLHKIGKEVDPEYFRMILAVLVSGSIRSAAERLNMSKSSLDRRLKDYVLRGGLYETLHGMLAVRNNRLGTRKLESFNETFAKHQVPDTGYDPDEVIEELVRALEEADPEHWPEVLSEFSDSLRGSS